MAFRKRHKEKVNEQPKLEEKMIEISAQMQGSLSFTDPVDLKISSDFTGTLEAKGTITVESSANVEAHITGENIIIAGQITGDIIAKKMLVLMPTAILKGNISTPKLNIVEGAVFQGQCCMIEDVEPSHKKEVMQQVATLSVEDVANYLEIDSVAILELANNGEIPATKQGDSWLFERAKIDRWASTQLVK